MKKLTRNYVVTPEQTALAMGSGDLEVLATPALVAMMENCSKQLVASALSSEQTSVGFTLDLKHLAPSPVGAEVQIVAEWTESQGTKQEIFLVALVDEKVIGQATHQRVIVETAAFLKKMKEKHNM